MSVGAKRRVQALEEVMNDKESLCVLMWDSHTAPLCPRGKPLSSDLQECDTCLITNKRQVFIHLPEDMEDDDES